MNGMKKRRSFEEIKKIVEQGEAKIAAGATVDDVCAEFGVSTPSYYGWRRKFSKTEVDQSKLVKDLERENTLLKRLVAEQALEIAQFKQDLGEY
jgi:putative transposase